MNMYSSDKKTVFPSLTENTVCDVLVIGGGASGLLCAYKLHSKGLKVVLVEKELIASGKTAYNCGMLFVNGSPSYREVFLRCKNKTSSALKEYSKSFDRFRYISEEIKDITYRDSKALYYTESRSHKAISGMRNEYQRRFFSGEKCTFLTWKDAMKLYSFNIVSGILTNSAAQHNPVRFCEKIADYLSLKGVEIYENSEIKSVNRDPAEKLFTSSTLNGSTVTSSAVIDCRGSAELCCREEPLLEQSVYYTVSEPVKDLTGWYCGSIITDDCKDTLYLRTDEQNRIVMTLRSNSLLRKLGAVYDRYMYRYSENLLRSMFFGINGLKIESFGKFTCRLPKNCIYGVREDDTLQGFFYICSNNTVGLQDSEIMAEKTVEDVFRFCGKK